MQRCFIWRTHVPHVVFWWVLVKTVKEAHINHEFDQLHVWFSWFLISINLFPFLVPQNSDCSVLRLKSETLGWNWFQKNNCGFLYSPAPCYKNLSFEALLQGISKSKPRALEEQVPQSDYVTQEVTQGYFRLASSFRPTAISVFKKLSNRTERKLLVSVVRLAPIVNTS